MLLLDIGLILAFILLAAVFVAAEIALVSLRDSQIQRLGSSGRRGAKLAALAQNPNRFLAAVQVGVTVLGFMSAAFGGERLGNYVVPILVGWGWPAGLADVVSLIVLTLIVAYVSLVIGELVPKRLALQRAEGVALAIAPFIDRTASILRPVIWLLSKSTDVVVRLLGGDPGASKEEISGDELRGMVASNESLSADERAVIGDVFDAGRRTVSEIMLPRTEVDFLEGGMTVSRAAKIARDAPHSRYPIIGKNQDDVIGFVHIRDLLQPTHPAGRAATVADVAREVAQIPGSKKVLSALTEMRRSGHHMAIIVDEYGGTDGIVTLEDLIEEIVGDITDEYDDEKTGSTVLGDGRIEVDGLLNLDDFAESTGLTLPSGPYETAAGFVLAKLGRIAREGDHVDVGDRRVSVTQLDGRRVARLRITASAAEPPAGQPAASGLNGSEAAGRQSQRDAGAHAPTITSANASQ